MSGEAASSVLTPIGNARRSFIRACLCGLSTLSLRAFPASASGPRPDPVLQLEADCIHAWSHPVAGTAYSAYFIGLPFGEVSRAGGAAHWLMGSRVQCRRRDEDRCARFGPSPERVPAAAFDVRWVGSRVDVYGRRYTIVSNVPQVDLIPYPDS